MNITSHRKNIDSYQTELAWGAITKHESLEDRSKLLISFMPSQNTNSRITAMNSSAHKLTLNTNQQNQQSLEKWSLWSRKHQHYNYTTQEKWFKMLFERGISDLIESEWQSFPIWCNHTMWFHIIHHLDDICNQLLKLINVQGFSKPMHILHGSQVVSSIPTPISYEQDKPFSLSLCFHCNP